MNNINTKLNVQLIRNQFEQNTSENKFVLKRSKTSIDPLPLKCETATIRKPAAARNFQRSKTTIDLKPTFQRSKTSLDLKQNVCYNKNQPILSRQLSDPAKRGNIKRTPAFRCEKSAPSSPVESNLTNKIRMFEQCQSKTKVSNIPKYGSKRISSSPTKYKTNQILKDELDILISKRLVLNDSTSSDSSKSPSPVIPQYSQVNKANKQKKTNPSIDNLTDTLKKALKSPLPDGPPPKKPPRTFAHSPQIRPRNDPVRMLDKLESALLQNKIKSPRTRRKVLDVENIKAKPINVEQHQSKMFDCFPMCSTNEYAKPMVTRSEFFVDRTYLQEKQQTLKPSSSLKRKEHIYAEPFDFQKNVPDLVKSRRTLSPHDGKGNLGCEVKTFERNLERRNSSNDLHYMCTPIAPASLTASTAKNNCKFMGVPDMVHNSRIITNNNLTKLNNECHSVQKFHPIANCEPHTTSTDSDFESSASTSSDENSSHNDPNPHTKNNYLYYILNNSMGTSQKQSIKRASSGRVRALIDKLENLDSASDISVVSTPRSISTMARKEPEDLSKPFTEMRSSEVADKQLEEKRKKLFKSLSVKRKQYVKRVSSDVKYTRLQPLSQCAPHLFDCCLLVGLNIMSKTPYIKSKFPKQSKVPDFIEHLCFPDSSHWERSSNSKESGGTYTIVLTNENGERSFGFCRRVLPEGDQLFLPLVYCILTKFHAVGFYNKILEEIESRHGLPDSIVNPFLNVLYKTQFPRPGDTIRVQCVKPAEFEYQKTPDSGNFSEVDEFEKLKLTKTVSSPLLLSSQRNGGNFQTCNLVLNRPTDIRVIEDNMAILLETLPVNILLQVFGSVLLERKIVFVCSTISKLSSCVEGLQCLLYPFFWQHTFIPVLPFSMIDILNAPTPYMIGVLSMAFDPSIEIEEGIVIDLDTGRIISNVGDESMIIPHRISRNLKNTLQSDDLKSTTNKNVRNVLISEAFIEVFVQICGTYRQFIRNIQFLKEEFIRSNRSKSNQLFLEWFTETAMFNAFIDTQLNPNPTALLCLQNDDIFAQRVYTYNERMSKKKTFGEKLKNWTSFN